jgi:hypothetical protein
MDSINSFQLEWITFDPIYEETLVRVLLHIFTTLSGFFIIPSCYGIIWFEWNSHFRTLINQLVASICWYQIIWICIHNFALLLQMYGPGGSLQCSMEVIFINVLGMQAMLLLDAIVISKYIFVFLLRNPVAIHDGYFLYFINISTFTISFISQCVYVWLPGRNPMIFYICIRQFPIDQITLDTPVKPNLPILTVLAFSIFVHIIVGYKLQKVKKTVFPMSTNQNQLTQTNAFADNQLLANFTSNIISIGLLIFGAALSNAFNQMTPQEMNRQPNIIFVFFCILCVPLILSYATILIYYSRHKNLQVSIKNEIKDCIQKILNILNSPVIDLRSQI